MEHSRIKKRKSAKDTSEAGAFKKALVTSTTNHSNIYSGGLDDLDLLGGVASGSEESSDSSEDEGSKAKQQQRGSILLSSLKPSAPISTPGATMAELLVSAGRSQPKSDFSHNNSGGVSDDVLRMQQQLQQQIPFDPTTSTHLTEEQLLESITGISNIQTILQQSMGASHHGTDLAHDPSILATLTAETTQGSSNGGISNNVNHITHVDANGASSSSSGSRKKSKSAISKKLSSRSTHTTSARNVDLSSRTLEEQLAMDLENDGNPLHTKWLMASALKEQGIPYKTGSFTPEEDNDIRLVIQDYVRRNNMASDAIERWFENSSGHNSSEKNELKPLWVAIAARLKTRPLLNIYLHVRRLYHPQNNIGVWNARDDQKLVMLYAKHKGQWTIIGTELGRMADSCRDRYRNHLKDRATMKSGSWSPDEDEELLSIMHDQALKQGKTSILEAEPMWTSISEKMNGTRTRHQCRHRYTQTLLGRVQRGEWRGPGSSQAAGTPSASSSSTGAGPSDLALTETILTEALAATQRQRKRPERKGNHKSSEFVLDSDADSD